MRRHALIGRIRVKPRTLAPSRTAQIATSHAASQPSLRDAPRSHNLALVPEPRARSLWSAAGPRHGSDASECQRGHGRRIPTAREGLTCRPTSSRIG